MCAKLVKKNDNAVQCDGCDHWVHIRCADIDREGYKLLQLSKPEDKWYCSKCSSPCGICLKGVRGDDPAIECDSCKKWIHNRCSLVDDSHYDHIQATNCIWMCPNCDNGNLSNTWGLTAPQTENSFHALNPDSGNAHSIPSIDGKSSARRPSGKTALKKEVSIVSININGLRGKKLDLQTILSESNPDVVALQETKIDSTVTNTELIPPCLEYEIFRNDRTLRGGGTMLLIKNHLSPTQVNFIADGSESIWAKVSINGTWHYIASWYRDPDAQVEHISLLRDQLSKIMTSHRNSKLPCFHVLGDFNFSQIDWAHRLDKDSGNSVSNHSGKLLLDIINDFAADQLVKSPTRGNNTLDLVITNTPSQYTDVSTMDSPSDHAAIVCKLKCLFPNLKQPRRRITQYSKGDYATMRRDTRGFCIKYFNGGQDMRTVEENWQLIKSFLEKTVKANIPTKMTKSRKSLPWITDTIRRLVRRRNRLHAIFKKTGKADVRKRWVELRSKIKREVYISHKNYINGMIGDIKVDAKPFWRYINGQKKDKHTIPPLKSNSKVAVSDMDKAQALNSQFSSVFSKNCFYHHSLF
ncbi:hypothetical protein HOLleu_29537 [Holothuria leucospilota]|uniref:PHD-type domain-containing protein n=1 Tax=Holothuria leucospilota TaxID=206669 RepID=A0A9Q1BNV3_HOLLE|nr:hypothetical protein HOLleu_29537 [Holothuria leucospilota]